MTEAQLARAVIGWRKFSMGMFALGGLFVLTFLDKIGDTQFNVGLGIILVAFVLGNAAEWISKVRT
jgi:hypothetical protein